MILSGNIGNKKVFYEKVSIRPNSCVSFRVYRELFFNSTLHYHPEMELTYVVRGKGRVLIGDEWMTFSPGHLALIGKNVPHLYVSVPADGELSEFRVVAFDAFFAETLLAAPDFQPVRKMFDSVTQAFVFQEPELKRDFDLIRESDGPARLIRILELLTALSRRQYRIIDPSRHFSANRFHEGDSLLVDKAIRFLQRNFTRRILVGDAARHIGMETDTFRKFFRRHVFLSFTDYLLELRLTLACKLLQESSRSIGEIADLSGFRNLSNFNRLFLARRGMTPKAYRKL